MKILQVGKFYHPHPGGMETVLKNLAEGMVKNGHEVTVLCYSSDSQFHEDWINDVHIIRVPNFGSLFSQPLAPRLSKLILREAEKSDIVHYHSPNPLAESTALLGGLERSVVTYHSDIIRQRKLKYLYQPVLNRFLNRVNRIVVGTKNHIDFSPILPRFREKCEVIPFGVNTSHLNVTDEVKKRASELKEQYGEFVLFVGRLVGYKGIHVHLKAMEQISAHTVIVGEGPLMESLQERAKELGVDKRVHFIGRVSNDVDFAAYYHACKLLVLPSVSPNEAFGIVLIEAMACGKPTVTTRLNSGVSLVNIDGVTGIQVEPENSADLAQAINKILGDQQISQKMGNSAKSIFTEKYSQGSMVDSYLDLYRKISS